MCSNYVPVTRLDRLLAYFRVAPGEPLSTPQEVYPLNLAPFVHLTEGGEGASVMVAGQYGLLPGFAADVKFGRKTYNARSETVGQLASFRRAWARGQRCVIPAEVLYEPRYSQDGRAQRWGIFQPSGAPLGVAGIYERAPQFLNAQGGALWTFAMLTCNADHHPFYRQFHAPGDEKRMPVILDPSRYGEWLHATGAQAMAMCVPWSGQLEAAEAPRPPARSTRAARSGRVATDLDASNAPDIPQATVEDAPMVVIKRHAARRGRGSDAGMADDPQGHLF